jgi:hypothetical protein
MGIWPLLFCEMLSHFCHHWGVILVLKQLHKHRLAGGDYMKRNWNLIIVLLTLMLVPMPASAHDWHYDNDSQWQRTHNNDFSSENQLPFRWHNRFEAMDNHRRFEPINDREWEHRFPGQHAYRWQGPGFWHHGHYVTDAVVFFDGNNELVSIGYMADGVFIHFREDHQVFESHDPFFSSWWHR